MFNIILLESSISLLPKRFWNWPEAKAYHRRFGVPPERQILDISFHYDIVRTLKNPKLGRPDIVHLTLLSVFAIPREELGEIYVHTVEGTVYEVSKEVRLPKNYFRFLGLMSQLLSYGRVPPTGKALLKRIDDRGLKELAEGRLILMDERGERVNIKELCQMANDGYLIGIGAFPHGDFSPEVLKLSVRRVSVSSRTLEAYQVACMLASACSL